LDLTYLLTPREKGVVDILCREYWSKFSQDPTQDGNLVMFLGDNPGYATTWSAVSQKIPCFRNNKGFYWIPSKKRWMTVREKLSCLGLPVDSSVCETMATPPIQFRDAHRASSLIGNSMHLGSVCLAELVGLVSFGKRTTVAEAGQLAQEGQQHR